MSYLITCSSARDNKQPYVNAYPVETHEPYEQRLSDSKIVKGELIKQQWVTDDDPLTVFHNAGSVIISESGIEEYPILLEIYDDYRE